MKQSDMLKNGDNLICNAGSQPSKFQITSKEFTVNGEIVATVEDNVAGVNVQSFGSCKFAETCKLNSELYGSKLTWTNYVEKIRILGEYKINDNSICQCPIGGMIKKMK